MVRYHVRMGSPGCVALVLEALSLHSPFLVENRTPHPLLFRPVALEGPEPPFQKLPPYSAAGLAAIATSDVQKVLLMLAVRSCVSLGSSSASKIDSLSNSLILILLHPRQISRALVCIAITHASTWLSCFTLIVLLC